MLFRLRPSIQKATSENGDMTKDSSGGAELRRRETARVAERTAVAHTIAHAGAEN